jgi:hypothetical protein
MMQASAYPSSTTICRGLAHRDEASEAFLAALGEYSMQDPANGLRTIPLLRGSVNKDKRTGHSC